MLLAKRSCWEVERVGAKGAAWQMMLVASSPCLEPRHLHQALPTRRHWHRASRSGGHQNTDMVGIDH